MNILYVDHVFHKKTKSSNFFQDIISKKNRVDTIYFDENYLELSISSLVNKCKAGDYDIVIVWQLEILALVPLAMEIPTVVVPMYDGCGNQPLKHWKNISQASIINFSYNLHVRLREMFSNSLLVKYFPNPSKYTVVKNYDEANVFAWLRRPQDIDAERVFRLTRAAGGRLHFHTPADSPTEINIIPDWMRAYNVTTSDWFASKSDFEKTLNQFNVTVCPRLAEGIGMFMLEAMARGMGVIACGVPVHNEYISNNINGYLFDHGSYGAVDLSELKAVGQAARHTVEFGFINWQDDIKAIEDFVNRASSLVPDAPVSISNAQVLVDLYFNNMDGYLSSLPELDMAEKPELSKVAVITQRLTAKIPTGEQKLPKGGFLAARQAVNSIPGWSFAKKFIPNRLKQRIASKLSD